jgi:site-specific DNA-methyltransferase (adenine-specific)/modification methylase
MTPYAQGKRWTLYAGDCLDALAAGLISADSAIVTDPPFGVSLNTAFASNGRSNACKANDYPRIIGDEQPFDPSPWLPFPSVAMFGANYFADRLPPSGCWLVWDKRDGLCVNDQADAELVWTKGGKGTVPRLFHHAWMGMVKASEHDARRTHPAQKPVAVMRWVLEWMRLADGQGIVDPYCGSASTGVAALEAGRSFIGIEREPAYLDGVVERLTRAESSGVQVPMFGAR